jgi:hypothetical protein
MAGLTRPTLRLHSQFHVFLITGSLIHPHVLRSRFYTNDTFLYFFE